MFRAAPEGFDLIMTNVTMPKLTGVDLAREMLKQRPELPVILMTGFSGGWTKERARQLGVRDMLFKPISLQAMANAIESSLHPAGK
jgi:DNA-binding NtrC family response regulator